MMQLMIHMYMHGVAYHVSILTYYYYNFMHGCSAGVGRTGTLIAIDIALSQASKDRQVDIPKIIVDMRRQRMKMVQNAVCLMLCLKMIQSKDIMTIVYHESPAESIRLYSRCCVGDTYLW